MPIRINLLAETQALEDLRRRDPVKRSLWVGACVVLLMVAGSSWLQLKVSIAKVEMKRAQGLVAARKAEYDQVLKNQRTLQEVEHKLGSLQQLATNRFLYGNLMNALQRTTIDDVQLVRLRTEQAYLFTDAVKPKTNDDRVTPGRPATVTEKILLTLEARDSGPNPGDQVKKFKEAVANCAYFQSTPGKSNDVRMASVSPPNSLDGKPFVQFTLECRYQEKTR